MTDVLLTPKWIKILSTHSRLVVAYSGGLDSSVLLHAVVSCLASSLPVTALHVNHGLSDHAGEWVKHCQNYCSFLKVPCIIRSVSIYSSANIEQQARKARYDVLRKYVEKGDAVLLAHHAADQAETLLLQLFRGTGIEGLAAMPEATPFSDAMLYRPFLRDKKETLERYAMHWNVPYIHDESNQNTRFARNFIRHELMPVIKNRWPAVEENLLRTASHCQQAKSNLADLACLDMPQLKTVPGSLALESLLSLPFERQINILRYWLLKFGEQCPPQATLQRILTEVARAPNDAMPSVNWGKISIRRYQNTLYFLRDCALPPSEALYWENFPQDFHLSHTSQTLWVSHPDKYLHGSRITVRFRKGGEQIYWKGHQRSLKKLMQAWCIPPWERERIPLIFSNDTLIAVVGYAHADALSDKCRFHCSRVASH